ncbi:MAG: phosphodiester glycosidase family protein [Clostridiaceae bacterium]|nr:phosphodiester glycosidase family protein [Clostridiaceae bacterium]
MLWFICSAVAKKNAAKELFPSNEPDESAPPSPTQAAPVPKGPLYNYYNVTESKENFTLSMHVLEVDLSNPYVIVRPVTSHSTLFGYAFLSEMHEKWEAVASVNGGFSHTYGLPGGMYAAYGELFTTATGQYPVLFLKEDKVFFEDVKTFVHLEGKMDDAGNTVRMGSIYYNQYPKGEGLFVFTPSYGSENRIDKPHLNAVISNGEVRGLATSHKSFEIPKDGFLVSAIGDYAVKRLESLVEPGMKLEIVHETLTIKGDKVQYDWAFECGSRIIKDGEIVVPDSDTWVGTLNSRAPRTAVGIKDDGTLVFVAVDGRQKGLSDGLTGKELAQRLLTLGIKDAAFLDGGASTEMIVDGKIVNSPSAGRERMIASCFIIKERQQ